MEEPQLGEDGQMLWSKGRTSLDETSYICGPYLLKRGPGRALLEAMAGSL